MVTFPVGLATQKLLLQKGQQLFSQGGDVENIYLITAGRIKLIRTTIDGTPVVLHIGQAGETVAEASLFSKKYHCSAVADVDSKVTFIKKQALLDFLEDNPKEMYRLLALLACQVRDLRAINEIKNIRSAQERILAFIRCNVDENKEMNLEISLKDTAHRIGLAHETFYRELKQLEALGIISRKSSQIKLL